MKVFTSRYELRFKPETGIAARHGELLKFEFHDDRVGYADLQSWPELGDPSRDEIIESLLSPHPQGMARRLVDLARASLTECKTVERIQVHRLVPNLYRMGGESLDQCLASGFTHVKFKARRLDSDLIEHWQRLHKLSSGSLLWRLDLNGSLTASEFALGMRNLGDEIRSAIDFIEDPCAYSDEDWSNSYGVALAVDRALDASRILPRHAEVIVVKPELHDGVALRLSLGETKHRYVYTHNLGHPFGIWLAQQEALSFYNRFPELREVCGLGGLELYENSDWVEVMRGIGSSSAITSEDTRRRREEFETLLGRLDWRDV